MMKNPSHPGLALKDEVEALDPPISVAKVAEALGVTRSQLHRVLSGESAISPEMALRLEMANIGTADHWLRMQMHYDLAQTRLRTKTLKVRPLAPKVA
jgi:addiction module HigA family antidote